MDKIKKLIQHVQKTQHGFLDIQKTANEVVDKHSTQDSLIIAKQLFSSEMHRACSVATFILGRLAAKSKEALVFMKKNVSRDSDWRVQEILAKAFDQYCSDIGYKKSLTTIKTWLADPSPNVRRAVTEGLRIWTGRPFFVSIQKLRFNY
jgi:hypothetical protein